MFASPVIASAQSVSVNNSSLIAVLKQLVAILTQELNALIAARGGTALQAEPNPNPNEGVISNVSTQTSAPTCTLTANPTVVTPSSPTLLTWTTSGATSAQWFATNGEDNGSPLTGSVGMSGTTSFIPTVSPAPGSSVVASASLEVSGPGGSSTCTTNITVDAASNPPGANLTVTPSSGSAPLTVEFNVGIGATSIDFGDGTASPLQGYCSASSCSISHIYKFTGTYTVGIYKPGPTAPIATAVITVTGNATQTFADLFAVPSSGTAPLTTVFSTTPAVPNDAIDFGDGSPLFSLNGFCNENACASTHTYTAPGVYTMHLVTVPAGTVINTARITVTGSN